jgi:hypothetical protein
MSFAEHEKRLNKMTPATYRANLGTQLVEALDRLAAVESAVVRTYLKNAFLLAAPTLQIKAEGSKLVKSGAAIEALVAGIRVSKAENTDMPMPMGTVATTKFAAWAFDMDSSGTLSVTTKSADADSAAAALAGVAALAANKVRLGYAILQNGSAGNWAGNTDNLDAADITVTYINEVAEPTAAL